MCAAAPVAAIQYVSYGSVASHPALPAVQSLAYEQFSQEMDMEDGGRILILKRAIFVLFLKMDIVT
ncbi:hypothetical protein CHELA40_10448 [Chelatococcus asaccharovorans]|nr:hypothetical protein CHELA40_10448 [Chelatococcus asaccharovorans]CAH1686682.1 hypothetical protein CHELA17_65159 [Chelatococcus asaccharovorans]